MSNKYFKLTRLAVATLFFGLTLNQVALAKAFTSQPQATDVIELYTSEGCSSCPRADRWFSTLKHTPELFRDIIPMAFHVDYWDYIGWKDRFGKPAYSLRQREHVNQGNSSQSYTPQFVANSHEWRAWHSGQRQWDRNDKTVGVLSASLPEQSSHLHVRFNPESNAWSTGTRRPKHYVINTAILGMGLQSTVTDGENANRVLHHDFVVLNHTKQTVAAQPAQWTIKMPDIPQSGQTQSALVVWLSEPVTQKTIQATGGYL